MPDREDLVVEEEPGLPAEDLWRFYVENNCCETRYSMERATSVLQHSAAIVTARDHGKLVGVARAVSDGLSAQVMELSVALSHQGSGARNGTGALVVLLAGSWARGEGHADSDLDLVAIDESVDRVWFEGLQFEDWIVEVCALNPAHAAAFFDDSAKHRSAPVVQQVVDSVLVAGDPAVVERIRQRALAALDRGPEPITDSERLEVRFDLTLLREHLLHSSRESLPALAAYAHVQLSRAVLDASRCWRAERRGLRCAVVACNPDLAGALDGALIAALGGDPVPMAAACTEVLSLLGGPQRTYGRFTA